MRNERDSSVKIDLHTHTSYSDGALTTKDLLLKAKERGISTISITDHDGVSALEEGAKIAKKIGVDFIPGIEITSRQKRFQLHFLGYFFDYTDKGFLSRLIELRDARVQRAKRIVLKLNNLKIPLKLESVLERAGVMNSVGRPHIANTMVEQGYAESYDEVFDKYIGIGRPAYEANYPFPPELAIGMIKSAGGVAYLAHPSHYINDDLLQRLVGCGLDGVEVIHPSHSEDETSHWNDFADSNSILKSGGSDFHGGLRNDDHNLGIYLTEESWLDDMTAKITKKSRAEGELIGDL